MHFDTKSYLKNTRNVTTRLSKPKTIVNFFFYISHGAGNQRT